MEPKLIARISGGRSDLAHYLLESKNLSVKLTKSAVIVDLPVVDEKVSRITYFVPKEIREVEAEILIFTYESGYRGEARISCGTSGMAMRPYYINEGGLAFFAKPEMIINIFAQKNGVVKITQLGVSSVDRSFNEVKLETETLWLGNFYEDGALSTKCMIYNDACQAAIRRASIDYQPSKPFYISDNY